MENKKELLRSLPKVDECLSSLTTVYNDTIPFRILKESIRTVIEQKREKIISKKITELPLNSEEWLNLFKKEVKRRMEHNYKPVINATGVVVHTNLGRSLLPIQSTEALKIAASSYSNLEFDLATGKRGSRYSLVEEIICELTGAEAALVVNNNAAAVLLVLDTFAKDTEVIVSRGQLVEIGGSFRIPDVMAKSGAALVEVGATNRTHLRDYENAITERTSMLLRVHTSNFRLIGFTSEVSPTELATLARERGLMTMEDLGSGSLIDLSSYGLMKEPTVQEVVNSGIDVVTFSGDKLLGGPQAGIIVGTRKVIDSIKKNPLNRALRIDKFTLASLESILRYYYDLESALKNVPTLAMLTVDPQILKKRAQKIVRKLKGKIGKECKISVVETVSRVGGGAMPECNLPSWAVQLDPLKMKLSKLEKHFRTLEVPIIGRIENEAYILDVRTVQETEVAVLSEMLIHYFSSDED